MEPSGSPSYYSKLRPQEHATLSGAEAWGEVPKHAVNHSDEDTTESPARKANPSKTLYK